jgi:hypothetical protein
MASTVADLETIDYEWSWDTNLLFPAYKTEEFIQITGNLDNYSALSIDHVNLAVSSALMAQHNANKTLLDYLKSTRQSEKEPMASIDALLILVLTLFSIASCYHLFKNC